METTLTKNLKNDDGSPLFINGRELKTGMTITKFDNSKELEVCEPAESNRVKMTWRREVGILQKVINKLPTYFRQSDC